VGRRSDTRARILLLLPALEGGGAQRVTRVLHSHLDRKRYEVHLALLTQSRDTASGLANLDRIHFLEAKRARYAVFRLIVLVCKLRPDLLFIGMAHLAPLVLLLRVLFSSKMRILLRQNGSVSSILAVMKPRVLFGPILAAAYKRADLVICQTQFTAGEVQRQFHLDQSHLCVLPNPVDIEEIRRTCSSESRDLYASSPYILAIGRLETEKGFDLLLDAFAGLSRDSPGLRLLIAGSGSRRPELRGQSRRLGLEKQVEFLGTVPCPSQFLLNALAFVLPSREDELPNALLEAAAAGIPIIATPASPGLVNLLTHRSGVWLARDTSAAALEQALREAVRSIHPSRRFRHEWIEPFGLSAALAAYDQVFEKVLNGIHE
jgi:glycosyltransferase involved in cell wall biosynthesis